MQIETEQAKKFAASSNQEFLILRIKNNGSDYQTDRFWKEKRKSESFSGAIAEPLGGTSFHSVLRSLRQLNNQLEALERETVQVSEKQNEKMHSLKRIGNVFSKTIERWELNDLQRNVLLGLECASNTTAEEVLCGENQSRDVNDRIGYVIKIGLGLQILFGSNRQAEVRWMNSKRLSLNHLTPIEHMLQGELIKLVNVAELVNRDRGL